ncbi:MAG: hypothetical protein M1825_006038, partial [Sarcosagium campestre]
MEGRTPSTTGRGASASANIRPPQRRKISAADLILPQTGERVYRTVTFRDPLDGNASGASEDEDPSDETPLLRPNGTAHRAGQKPSRLPKLRQRVRKTIRRSWTFATSTTGRDIVKCSLAYLLGSMATFVAPISGLLGTQDGKHVVATVTVYFHAARSQGSMYEATILASFAFLYAAFISFSSMGVSVAFANLDLRSVGHAVVLVVFCGGGLGFVGWLKQSMGSPLVNVACSLTSLAIITVLTKEGAIQTARFSFEKISQVLKMIIMGIIATAFVCLVLSPVSARQKLRESMNATVDSLGEALGSITGSFLRGSEDDSHDAAQKGTPGYDKAVFSTLTNHLREAAYEHYVVGTENILHIERKLVKCLQRLAQDVGGLRSAADTQIHLLGESSEISLQPGAALFSPDTPRSRSVTSLADAGAQVLLMQAKGKRIDAPGEFPFDEGSLRDRSATTSLASSAEVFTSFISRLGPSMKSLAYTLREILDELPFRPGTDYDVAINRHFKDSLKDAVDLYRTSRSQALDLLYRDSELSKIRPFQVAADFEEVAASCGYFSFTLLDFAEEVRVYLEILEELGEEVRMQPQRRSWKWLMFWRRRRSLESGGDDENGAGHGIAIGSEEAPLLARQSGDAVESEAKGVKETIGHSIWRVSRVLRRDDITFAVKVGVGAALYALPSFIDATRPLYSHWRGEWGLLSYMLVCSMTIGASNTTSLARFLGTCVGAVCAVVGWAISQGNAIALAFFGWVMSLFCFYIIIAKGKGPMGRFVLLTYNLSALYAYSLSVKDEDGEDEDEGGWNPHLVFIASHRVVAVTTGCLWGLIVTRLIWPISARQKVKDGLSLLWLRMGLLWKRDPLSALISKDKDKDRDKGKGSSNAYMDLQEELELQRYLTQLDDLRGSAGSEYELKGPFPDQPFLRVLRGTSRMLDAFHAMNMVIMKDPKASEGEAEILRYTVTERAQLCARISHHFQVLASSVKMEYPLTGQLPSIEHTRDRFLMKIFNYRKGSQRARDTTEADYSLLYAFALVTGQLAVELNKAAREVEQLYGVLNEDL